MTGVGPGGEFVPLPPDLSSTLSLNQPHQIDPAVHTALEPWSHGWAVQLGSAPTLDDFRRWHKFGVLETNLNDGLHATRYHLRQFLCRFRDVDHRNAQAHTSASEQLQVVLNDLPMRCELEAFLIRVAGALDAMAQLVGLILTGKPRTYHDLVEFVKKGRNMDEALRDELRVLFDAAAPWIREAKQFRNAIVHEGELESFKGPVVSNLGVSSAALARDDAADFALRTWTRLRELMRSVAEAADGNAAHWIVPGPSR